MYKLSIKEYKNIATPITQLGDKAAFMGIQNQMLVTKHLYQMHRHNHGQLGYLYFKSAVPRRMREWISAYCVPLNDNNVDMIAYLDKTFIRSCYEMYTYKSMDVGFAEPIDTNVHRSTVTFGTTTNDSDTDFIISTKKYGEMMPEDYGQIDVWQPISVEITTEQATRKNVNNIWQRNMNHRHYDTDNQGYATSAKRASLDSNIYGYGNAMQELIAKKDVQYKKDSGFDMT